MGRHKSEYTCPICQRQGYLEYSNGYRRVIHYNSVTKTRRRCYVEKIINDKDIEKRTREFEKQFSQISPTDFLERSMKLIDKHPHNRNERNEIKAEREALQYIAVKRDLPLARYRKESAKVPSKELQGESSLYNEVKGLAQDYLKVYKCLDRISKRIYQLKPNKENSDRLAHKVSIFREGIMNTQNTLFVPIRTLDGAEIGST